LLIALASDSKAKDSDRAQAIRALNNIDDAAALETSVTMLGALHNDWLKRTSEGRYEIRRGEGAASSTPPNSTTSTPYLKG